MIVIFVNGSNTARKSAEIKKPPNNSRLYPMDYKNGKRQHVVDSTLRRQYLDLNQVVKLEIKTDKGNTNAG